MPSSTRRNKRLDIIGGKKKREILDHNVEVEELRKRLQVIIDDLVRPYNVLRLDESIRGDVETVGVTIGRRDQSFNIRFVIYGAVPLTVEELAKVNLNSLGWKRHGPLHRWGNRVIRIGVECTSDSMNIKANQAFQQLMEWREQHHIKLIERNGVGDITNQNLDMWRRVGEQGV